MTEERKRQLLKAACIRQTKFLEIYHPEKKEEINEYMQLIKEYSDD